MITKQKNTGKVEPLPGLCPGRADHAVGLGVPGLSTVTALESGNPVLLLPVQRPVLGPVGVLEGFHHL